VPQAPAYSVRARAPLRITLAGDGTDVPPVAGALGGASVAAALNVWAQVEVRLGGRTIRLRGEDPEERVSLESPAAIAYDGHLDRPKAALNMLPVTGGVEILTWVEAPAGTGLGRRGALDAALLAALCECRRDPYTAAELAELAFHLEAVELKRFAGRQDPWLATLGGVRGFTFSGEAVEQRPLALEPAAAVDLSAHLLLAHCHRAFGGSEPTSRRVWEAYAAGDTAVITALAEQREVVEPMIRALEQGDWHRAGDLFDEAAKQRAILDPTWTTEPVCALRDAVRAAGAWGIKPAGMRPGASLLIAGPRERRDAIVTAVKAQGWGVLPTALSTEALTVWLEPREG
jgi:D-glycero-alpha-D-manno-heptose-7-phosphate kinase